MLILFIALNGLAVLLMACAVWDYYKLKKHLSGRPKQESSFAVPIIEVLFNSGLREIPAARKIQKRAIGLFCLALALTHVASEVYRSNR